MISATPNPSTNGAYTVSWSVSGATSYKLEELVADSGSQVWGISGTTKAFRSRPNGSYGYRVQV